MSDIKFQEFDIKIDEWESYIERFGFFIEAKGISDVTRQKAIFYASCGADLYALIKSLIFPQTVSQVSLVEVINTLNSHFSPRPNEIVESYKFHMRKQNKNESMQDYIATLRKMTKHCNFVDLERTLRDRLVCGVYDTKLQDSLLKKTALTYELAVEMALQAEKRESDLKVINRPEGTAMEQAAGPSVTVGEEPMEVSAVKEVRNTRKSLCYRCGGSHLNQKCLFVTANCFRCGGTGHIARVCRRTPKKQAEVKEIDEFMNGLHSISGPERVPPIMIEVKVNGAEVQFEVDSGCSYTIICENMARSIWNGRLPRLAQSSLNLHTWTYTRVQLLGSVEVAVEYGEFKGKLTLLIARGQGQNLLGRNWFKSLGISVDGVNSIEAKEDSLSLLLEKYEEVFKEGLGEYTGPKVEITCKKNTQPKFMRSRPIPFAIRDRVCNEIDRLVEVGVIEPIPFSNWATPIVPVPKKNGSIRLCADYRLTVNTATETDTYPQPTINESLSELAGGTVFTKLDLKEAYTQVKVTENTAKILTINTPKGLYKMKRLPYGLKACPGIFQRLMSNTLAGIKGVTVLIDDILLAGRNMEEHNEILKKVLERLMTVGLRLNKKKCEIATDRVEFLGYVVDSVGIHPCAKKIDMIKKARAPKNVKELQAFLGLLNFYERFIRKKAELLEPLHRLLDKDAEWRWSSKEREAFNKAKTLLSSEDTLIHFDNAKPVVLTCDASQYAVGAILAHTMEDGTEKPIAMGSRTLNKTERNYGQIDKEAAAIMFGLEKFHQYIYGRHVLIYTDHKPLLGIFSPNKAIPQVLSPRMMRWALKLNSYDYELQYKCGSSIVGADALSRWPMETSKEDETSMEAISDVLLLAEKPSAVQYSSKDIAAQTASDEVMSKIKYWILHGWPDRVEDERLKIYWVKRKELSMTNDCIIWGSRVVIPPSMRQHMLDGLHETHDGVVVSKAIARSYFWWPGLDHEIEHSVAKCERCQVHRNMPASTGHSWITPANPWQRLHIDFAGPVDNRMFLILIDAHSKWPEAKVVRTTSSECAIKALRDIFAEQGLPEVLVSDNGTAFSSTEFKKFTQDNGIRHILTPPYSPSSNGQAERTVQTIKNKLKMLSGRDLGVMLPRLLFGLRTSPSTVTGKTPAEMLNKRRFRTRFDIIHPFSAKPVAEQQIEKNKDVPTRLFSIRDRVWLRTYTKGKKWIKGTITKVQGPVRFLVEIENGPVVTRHINQLRRRDTDTDIDPDEMRDMLGIPQGSIVTCDGDVIKH